MLIRSCGGGFFKAWLVGDGNRGALRVEQILLAGTKAQLNEGSGVGKDLRLPVVIALKASEGVARCLIPLTTSFAVEVMLADQGLLDFNGAVAVDRLLAAELGLADYGNASLAVSPASAGYGARCGLVP